MMRAGSSVESHCSFTQPRPADVLVRRHAGHLLERAQEVIGTELRCSGQAPERQRHCGFALDRPHDVRHACGRARGDVDARAGCAARVARHGRSEADANFLPFQLRRSAERSARLRDDR